MTEYIHEGGNRWEKQNKTRNLPLKIVGKSENDIKIKIEVLINFKHCSVKCVSRNTIFRQRLFKLQNYMYGVEKTKPQKEMKATKINLKIQEKHSIRYNQTY